MEKNINQIPLAILIIISVFVGSNTSAQEICGTMGYARKMMEQDSAFSKAFSEQLRVLSDSNSARSVLTINIVFHVVYNNPNEYVGLQQIQDAVAILNTDYSRQNSDASQTGYYGGYMDGCNNMHSSNYNYLGANCEIQFRLCGVTYDYTSYSGYDLINYPYALKQQFPYYQQFPPSCYFNVWTCNMQGTLLGLSSFPGASYDQDGVSVAYHSLGYFNSNYRVLTHESGHWLGLHHIWGDATCGDDYVTDTAPQQDNNGSMAQNHPFPNLPHYSSCNTWTACPNYNVFQSCFDGQYYYYPYVNMGDNYMDYSPSSCLNFFSTGQKQRMWYHINNYRNQLASPSCICNGVGIEETPHENHLDFIRENDLVKIQGVTNESAEITMFDTQGKLIFKTTSAVIDVSSLPAGLYILKCGNRVAKFIK